MEPASSLSVMPHGMLIGTPYFLMWLRIVATGYEPTGRSFSSCGPHASTHYWKNPTDHALLDSCLTHLPRSGWVNMAAGAALSKVGGVRRDSFFNIEAPPIAIPETLFADMGGHTIISFWGWSMLPLTCGVVFM